MNILYWGIDNKKAGMENHAKNLIPNLIKKGDNISIISQYEDYSYRSFFESLGCKSFIVPKCKVHPFNFYKITRQIFNKFEKDTILQINTMTFRNYFLFKAAKKSGLTTIVVAHGSNIKKNIFSLLNFIFKKRFSKCFNNIAVCNKSKIFLFGKNSKCTIIQNGIESSTFAFNFEKRKKIRESLNIEDTEICIGHIGRISPEKNQLFSLQLMQLLGKKSQNFKLVIVGDGDKNKLIKKCKKLGINNVIFLDSLNNISDYYNAFDILILPSFNEGLPLVLLEASANGLYCITSTFVDNISSLNNIEYLPLDTNLWELKILNFNESNRKNFIKKTNYEAKNMAELYNTYYKNLI